MPVDTGLPGPRGRDGERSPSRDAQLIPKIGVMTTRLRSSAATIRLGSAALLLAAALPLSACGFPLTPYAGGAVAVGPGGSPQPSPMPTDTMTDDPSASGSLLFDQASLPAGSHVEWSDGLIADPRWKMAKPDDGKGNWSYATVDGVCTAQFWQGASSSTDAKDDREASDLMIAAITQAKISDVTAAAVDMQLKNALTGAYDIDSRTVQGHNDATTWVMHTRVFQQAGAGLYFILDCTDGSAATVADEVIKKNPIMIS